MAKYVDFPFPFLSLFLSLLRKGLASPAALTSSGCPHSPASLVSRPGAGVRVRPSLSLAAAPRMPSLWLTDTSLTLCLSRFWFFSVSK